MELTIGSSTDQAASFTRNKEGKNNRPRYSKFPHKKFLKKLKRGNEEK
jgi:hypothetical protein